MAEYRKRKGTDVWHWCTNCEDWPKVAGTYESERPPAGKRPNSGELDNECLSKERRNLCSTSP